MQRFFGVSQDINGNAIPSVTVTVNLAGTATLATLFSDNVFTPLANPFASNADGTYQFYTADGRFDVVLSKTGFTFTNTETTDTLSTDPASTITPAQIIANQNDYNPSNSTNVSVWRLNSDAARTVTGIVAPTSTSGARRLRLINTGTFPITLSNNSSSSAAGNRLLSSTGTGFVLIANGVVDLVYDQTTAAWRFVSLSVPTVAVTVAASYNNDASERTIFSATIPGNQLLGRTVRMVALMDAGNNSGVARTVSLRYKYGGTTLALISPASTLDDTFTQSFEHVFYLNGDASASQTGLARILFARGGAAGNVGFINGAGASAIDSTVDQTISITSQLSFAAGTVSVTPKFGRVEFLL